MSAVFYKTSSFKDYLGKRHKFVVCAVLTEPAAETMLAMIIHTTAYELDSTNTSFTEGDHHVAYPIAENCGDGHVRKSLSIGVSVCNPLDKFDEKIGKKIAYNKALSSKIPSRWLVTDDPDFFGEKVIDALLEQEVQRIISDPGLVIAGYDEAKAHHENMISAKKQYDALSGTGKSFVKAAMRGLVNPEEIKYLVDNLQGVELEDMSKPLCKKNRNG